MPPLPGPLSFELVCGQEEAGWDRVGCVGREDERVLLLKLT